MCSAPIKFHNENENFIGWYGVCSFHIYIYALHIHIALVYAEQVEVIANKRANLKDIMKIIDVPSTYVYNVVLCDEITVLQTHHTHTQNKQNKHRK